MEKKFINYKRISKINNELKKQLSNIINFLIKKNNFNIGIFTINFIKINNDLSSAKVYFSILKEDSNLIIYITKFLNSISYILNKYLNKNLKLYRIPKLHFLYNNNYIKMNKILNLLNKI